MRYILFLLLTVTIFSSHAESLNIITSTNHLASIANMVIRDKYKVTVISNTSNCPEHYHLKPSDIKKVKNADLVIYIDSKFENFIDSLIADSTKHVLKISNIEGLYIRDHNMHIWLDLEDTKLILEKLCSELSKIDPINQKLWENNLEKSKKELNELSIYKNKILPHLGKIILISNSLEYLFHGTNIEPKKSYFYPGMGNMQTLSKLQNIDAKACIIASSSENWEEFANKISHKIVIVDSEKWGENYIEHYMRIIDIIGRECDNR